MWCELLAAYTSRFLPKSLQHNSTSYVLWQPTQPNGLDDHQNSAWAQAWPASLVTATCFVLTNCWLITSGRKTGVKQQCISAQTLSPLSNTTVTPYNLLLHSNSITMQSLNDISFLRSPPMLPYKQQWHLCHQSESSSYHILLTLPSLHDWREVEEKKIKIISLLLWEDHFYSPQCPCDPVKEDNCIAVVTHCTGMP
jgi:hypothetical protein